ncbi:hypothetical protein UFOVP428_29 [uncultured Caudovirales phage]|uniref:Uncharacterized protein n=1 Tax=uncultured Caudovirales phage TaxID=2100421 RepID=A0A6J5MA49_9CAUD|nr:hypothetical protein UFOVP428_29 [uncultured Caudovirales phage]
MTPKEKANELVVKYLRIENSNEWWSKVPAKECALIAVDEVIKVCPYYSKEGCETIEQLRANDYEFITYWQEVKKEIENL